MLAICTARIEGCWVRPRALLHALHHHRVNIILTNFNLAVLTPTAKLPNLIPRQSYTDMNMYVCIHFTIIILNATGV